jgi:hypothetical protein
MADAMRAENQAAASGVSAAAREGTMRHALLIAVTALTVAGCAESGPVVNSITTAGVAAAVGSAINPAVGLIVGVAAGYGVDQGVKYGARRIQGNVQNAIAEAAGPLEIGASTSWEVAERLPITRRTGTVEVARAFGQAIPCKDIVFTVAGEPDLYTATLCRNGDGPWRWATAEPTVHRWGSLQ